MTGVRDTLKLTKFAPGVWVKDYPILYSGCKFFGRMTVIKLEDGRIMIHSPCEMDGATKDEIDRLGGTVAFIVAPGTYHHLHVQSCQEAFPSARTYLCPGLESKRSDIKYDFVLSDEPPGGKEGWAGEFDQIFIDGSRLITEVAFFHRGSNTLILVDMIENIGDHTPGTNWLLRFFWKYVVFMWNNPKPAPEYRMSWKGKAQVRACMNRILEWDFDKVIIAHGENITHDAKDVVRRAWKGILDEGCFEAKS